MKKPATPTKKRSATNNASTRRAYVLLGVALFAVVGVSACVLMKNQDSNYTSAQLVTAVANGVERKYDSVHVERSGWVAQMGSGTSLAAPGYNFGVSSQAMPSAYFTFRDDSGLIPISEMTAKTRNVPPEAALNVVSQVMKRGGYVATSLSPVTYRKKDASCTLASDQGAVTFSCYRNSDIAAAAKRLNPLAEALFAKQPELSIGQATIGPLVIKSQNGAGVIGSSHEAGYDLAELLVVAPDGSRKIALFYNKFNGPWKLVSIAGDEYGFSCADYTADPDARKALYDQVCLNENGQGQRRLDTNNHY